MEEYSYLNKIINCCKTFPLDIFEGIVITNQNGIIQYSDEKHSAIFGRTQAEEIGNSIIELNNCSLFPKVLKTGKPIICKHLIVKGKEFIGSIFPLKRKGMVIGGMGITIFKDTNLIKSIFDSSNATYCNLPNEVITGTSKNFENIIGESETFKLIKERAFKASKLDLPILLTGETGTGKMVFAKAIHNASPRSHYPFVSVNCGAIPKDLFETEFFGYAPGAFSGSNPKGKPGKFEIAHKGTIFLDEIGNLPLEFQIKFLDVLQEKEVVRVGGIESLNLDFRLITATSEDLERMVREKSFRSDLYFRINVVKIHLPPLRERKEDIPLLIQYKLKKITERYQIKGEIHINEGLKKHFMEYSFPGNVRELFNILERMIVSMKGNKIEKEDLLPLIKNEDFIQKRPTPLKILIDQAEKEAIAQVLSYTRGDVTDAAKILEIHRTTLYKKIEKHRIYSNF